MAAVVMTRSKKRRSLSLMSLVTSSSVSPIPKTPLKPVLPVRTSDRLLTQASLPAIQTKDENPRLGSPSGSSFSKSSVYHRRSTSWPTVCLSNNTPQQEVADHQFTKNPVTTPSSFIRHVHIPDNRKQNSKIVDDRVLAMLAATASLKPQPAMPPPVVGSSMLLKVSSAIDRLYPKPSRCSSRESHARLSKQLRTSPAAAPEQQSPHGEPQRGPSHLTTIEMRLNEGNNLNRKKVQRIVGGSLSRKPVPGQGQGILTRLASADEEAEPCRTLVPGLNTHTITGTVAAENSYYQDAFTSEQHFEDDLVNGFLSTSPAASSTPKRKMSRDSNCSNSIHHGHLGRIPLFIYNDLEQDPRDSDHEQTKSYEAPVDVFSDSAPAHSFKPRLRSTVLRDAKRVKKHPSPSKNALEDLEAAFTKYVHLRRRGQIDDVDELASEFNIVPPLLIPQDSNRHLSRSMGRKMRSQGAREGSPLGQNGDGPKLSLKRIFPLVEHSTRMGETDELQL